MTAAGFNDSNQSRNGVLLIGDAAVALLTPKSRYSVVRIGNKYGRAVLRSARLAKQYQTRVRINLLSPACVPDQYQNFEQLEGVFQELCQG